MGVFGADARVLPRGGRDGYRLVPYGQSMHLVLSDYEDTMSAAMHRLLFDVRAAVQ